MNQEKIDKFYGKHLGDASASWKNKQIEQGFFDFLWTTDTKQYESTGNTEYYMIGLVQSESQITLEKLIVIIDSNYYINFNPQGKNHIIYKSDYTHGYFYENKFYWMSCNTTDDFKCGYSLEEIYVTESQTVNVENIIHDKSPFDFLDNSPFVYYKIKSNEDNQIYYGIIDIISNRIIFNTNEILTEYKPFTNFSMLAFTSSGVYQICTFKEDNECVKNCSSGKTLILDPVNGNHCGTSQDCDNYLFVIKLFMLQIKIKNVDYVWIYIMEKMVMNINHINI